MAWPSTSAVTVVDDDDDIEDAATIGALLNGRNNSLACGYVIIVLRWLSSLLLRLLLSVERSGSCLSS